MKVKIISSSCSSIFCWYINQIGSIIEVVDSLLDDDLYEVRSPGKLYIRKNDCEVVDIIKEEDNNKYHTFKIGDKVTIKNNNRLFPSVLVNQPGTIKGFYDSKNIIVLLDEDKNTIPHAFYINYQNLILTPDWYKFKIGDRVKVISSSNTNSIILEKHYNKFGTIYSKDTGDNKDLFYIFLDDGYTLHNFLQDSYYYQNFIINPEDDPKLNNTIKVKIISCKNSNWWYSNEIGKIYEVDIKQIAFKSGNTYITKDLMGYIHIDDCIITNEKIERQPIKDYCKDCRFYSFEPSLVNFCNRYPKKVVKQKQDYCGEFKRKI